ncbi:MAG: hypothetical protein FWG65_13020 [Turicibacter sp.]|nr:hypothetical protein [Turicibacter sp.]
MKRRQTVGKRLNLGYAESITRSSDAIIGNRQNKGGDLHFGDPVVINPDNTISKMTDANGRFIGVAMPYRKRPKERRRNPRILR